MSFGRAVMVQCAHETPSIHSCTSHCTTMACSNDTNFGGVLPTWGFFPMHIFFLFFISHLQKLPLAVCLPLGVLWLYMVCCSFGASYMSDRSEIAGTDMDRVFKFCMLDSRSSDVSRSIYMHCFPRDIDKIPYCMLSSLSSSEFAYKDMYMY